MISVCALKAQNIIPISKIYEVPQIGDRLLIELNSAKLVSNYNKTEVFDVFFNDVSIIDSRQVSILSFDQCTLAVDADYEEFQVSAPKGDLNKNMGQLVNPKFPLELFVHSTLKQGEYEIVVRDSISEKKIHRRLLTLVNPVPDVSSFEVQYPDKAPTSNRVVLNQARDFIGVKFVFEGDHLDHDFKSVTMQGLRLNKLNDEPNTFVTGEDWVPSKMKEMSLENPRILFERYHVKKKYPVDVELDFNDPIIANVQNKEIEAGIGTFMLSIEVENLFDRAQIIIDEMDDNKPVLKYKGLADDATISSDKSIISHRIHLLAPALRKGHGKFKVHVINRDGSKSNRQVVEWIVKKSSVSAMPSAENYPFIEGYIIGVKFKRQSEADPFVFSDSVVLNINEYGSQTIKPRNIDAGRNQFTADIFFPNGLSGSRQFEVRDGDRSWRGFFNGIIKKPAVIHTSNQLYSGHFTTIQLEKPSGQIKAIITPDVEGVTQLDNDFTDAKIKITADHTVPIGTSFTVVLFFQEQELDRIDYSVIGWDKPAEIVEFAMYDSQIPIDEQNVLVVKDNTNFELQSKKGVARGATNKLTAQLLKSDGTKLGVAQPLLFLKDSIVASTKLSPSVFGIEGGQEFMVQLVNPLGQPTLQRVYVRRDFKERLLVNAGISAVNVFLKEQKDEDGNNTSRTSLISGVNLGLYYILEKSQTVGKRPLGFGLNLMGQQGSAEEVDLRYGASLLLFETMTIGLSFGSNEPALFIGANVSFLDLSKIFSASN